MITIAVSSQKGGVGKTTLSINLAHAFARSGIKTLLVDADPQGSVGLSLTRQARTFAGFYDYLSAPDTPLDQLIIPTRIPTFSLCTCGQSSDYETSTGLGAYLSRMRGFLHQASQHPFDLCIVDTAAGLFGLAGDVISTCDAVLIPQQAEPLGIRSIPKLLEGLDRLRVMNPRLQILGVCLTMVQLDLPESTATADALRSLLPPSMVFDAQIPRNPLFIQASARGLPVAVIDQKQSVLPVFDQLQAEILKKIPALAQLSQPES